jgi:hypothetical protein
MARFERPVENIEAQDTYGDFEVGITHPLKGSFIRLNDAGDVEIVVSDALAIVLHKATNSITFVADSIKFLTKDGDSIRWNNSNLNSRATDFTQPALIPLQVKEMDSMYDGSDTYYVEEDE